MLRMQEPKAIYRLELIIILPNLKRSTYLVNLLLASRCVPVNSMVVMVCRHLCDALHQGKVCPWVCTQPPKAACARL